MQRADFLEKITDRFKSASIVALLGPRQCGKTTLAQLYTKIQKQFYYFDLENPIHLAALLEPMLALQDLEGLIVIDEIQLKPDLFPILRVLVDGKLKKQQFLILGSASRDLIKQSSETLAGRISYIECTPFNLKEVRDSKHLLHRGGFPRSYLAETDEVSYQWRQDYISTFLERDIPNLGFRVPARTMRRFWMMLTHYHGQIFNASELGKSLGAAHTTIRHYLDILTGTFMIRELTPWIENIEKRQIKAPKIYFRDSGILLALLNITTPSYLHMHPKLGAIWEGFAMEQVISTHGVPTENCFFWGVHQQAELDLLLMQNNQRMGFEFKYSDAPKLTKSMQSAYEILELNQLTVIYPGKTSYSLSKDIKVMGLNEYIKTA